jgi:hypothetical protein
VFVLNDRNTLDAKKSTGLLSACVSLATISLSAKEPEFSRNRDLPPLKLLALDLDTILQKAHSFIAAANGPPGEQDSVRASVTHGVGGKEIEVRHFSLASSVAFPKEVSGSPTVTTDRISRSPLSQLICEITHAGCRSVAKPRIKSKQYPICLRTIFCAIEPRLAVRRSVFALFRLAIAGARC